MYHFRFFYLCCILSFLAISCQSDETDFLDEVIEKYQQGQSISYDIEYIHKSFSYEEYDTTYTRVLLKKEPSDSLFGGKILLTTDTDLDSVIVSHTVYYDLHDEYYINDYERSIFLHKSPQASETIINGNVLGDVKNVLFFETNLLSEAIKDTNNKIKTKDLENFVQIEIQLPDDGDFQDIFLNISINKSSKTIDTISRRVSYKNLLQYSRKALSNVIFDNVSDETFDNEVHDYFKEFKLEEIEINKEEALSTPLLAEGKTAPDISGFMFPDYSSENKINFNRLTILDFWYSSCYPCIKAIPELNKLKENYSDKIQIIGVNPIDNGEDSRHKIEKFIGHTPIDYLILITDSIPSEYNIRAYPTIYIIDNNKRVRYSAEGYSENLYTTLDSLLTELIQ